MTAAAVPSRGAQGVDRPRVLVIAYILALFYALISAVVTLFTLVNDFTGKTISVALPIDTVLLKVNPTLKLEGVHAQLAGGGFDHATLDLTGLSFVARAWLAGGQLTGAATWILIAITLALLCNRISHGDPFSTLIPRAISVSAIVVLVGGFVSEVCMQIGQRIAIADTFGMASGSWANSVSGITPSSAYWPHSQINFQIDLWPLGLSLGLFALALVFRYGAKLTRERAALADELKGLV
jgi:hypothetical protein